MASRTLRSDPRGIVALLAGTGREDLARYLTRQRWFAAKTRAIASVAVADWGVLDPDGPLLLMLVDVDDDRYYVPVTLSSSAAAEDTMARSSDESVVDAHDDPRFARRALAAMAAGRDVAGQAGRFAFRSTPGWLFPSDPERVPAARHRGEQSNTSVMLGSELMLKSLRRPQPGLNPDLEIARFLTTRTAFREVPRLAGWVEYDGRGGTFSLAVLQEFVSNSGDGWKHVLAGLRQRGAAIERAPDPLLDDVRHLGTITGGLHVALASDPSAAEFAPEPITGADVERWADDIARDLGGDDIQRLLPARPGRAASPEGQRARVVAALDPLTATVKIRVHGDYHLGQVLKTRDGFMIIDFEGEPARPLADRRRRQAPLRDVAGMLRSLDYAAHAVGLEASEGERTARLAALTAWEDRARRAFLTGYRAAVTASAVPLVPASEPALLRACAAFELEKACYELRYELNNRPDWVAIPLAGITRILAAA
jgi:maltose alpha-D-glucosyltransferase/alpha-amylase